MLNIVENKEEIQNAKSEAKPVVLSDEVLFIQYICAYAHNCTQFLVWNAAETFLIVFLFSPRQSFRDRHSLLEHKESQTHCASQMPVSVGSSIWYGGGVCYTEEEENSSFLSVLKRC